jgi:hypothetical protein
MTEQRCGRFGWVGCGEVVSVVGDMFDQARIIVV